nr:LOW QUALITY PROTEIN: protein kintoun [Pogona vitticeps]
MPTALITNATVPDKELGKSEYNPTLRLVRLWGGLAPQEGSQRSSPSPTSAVNANVCFLESDSLMAATKRNPFGPRKEASTFAMATAAAILRQPPKGLFSGQPGLERTGGGSAMAARSSLEDLDLTGEEVERLSQPGREELSRRHGAKGTRRLVYDVLFHPDTLRLAARSARFRRLVQDTALEAVEKHFSPGLDHANAVPLRGVKYKGVPQATLLRTPLPGGVPPATPGEGRLRLPYPVDEDGGRATFHKAKGQLVVVLPVLAKPPPGAFASGQEEEQAGAEEGEGAGPSASSREPLEEEEEDAAALPAGDEARPTEPAPPVLHVGASGEALPGCAFQRDAEAAAATSLDASPSLPGSEGGRSPPHLPVDPAWESPEPPPCEQQGASLEGEGRARPALPVCATMSGPGEACAGGGGGGAGEEAGPDPHAAPVCAGGDSPEPPGGTPCPVAHLGPEPGLPDPGEIGSGYPGSSPASPIDGFLGQSTDPTPAPPARPASPRAPATPALCPQTSASLSLPAGDLDPGAPGNSPGCLAGPAPLLCPPFRCTQDETALTLLFEVPGILPQSLKGQVGTNHYGVSFASQEAASYSFLLRTLPENKLTPPEVEVSVTPNNAVIVLAKSPESTGLWTKLDFGPNAESLQERWFVTENNVAKFLGHLPRLPSSGQPEMEQCPLIEVLDVSEGKSQIRLKARDHNSFPPDQAEPRREEREAHEKGSTLSADAENGPMRSGGSRRGARETMGSVGRGPDHCLALDPIGPSSAVPEKLQTCEANESGHSSTTSKDTVPSAQAQLNWKEPAQISQEEDVHSESTQSKQRLPSRPAPPVIKETNMQDGSVEYISHHATRSAVTLQNSLLYELD